MTIIHTSSRSRGLFSGRRGTVPAADNQLAEILLFIIALLLATLLVRNGSEAIVRELVGLTPVWHGLLLIGALAFARVRYEDVAPFARRFGQASAIFLAFYFFTEPFAIPTAALPPDHSAVIFQKYGRWIGLALGVATWFRPAAGFAGAMTLWLMRDLNGPITGFYFSNLDIRNIAEVIAFVSMGSMMVGAVRQWPRARDILPLSDHVTMRILLLVTAIGIGGHFANYFYSAIAKLALDGGPFTWLFDNRLYDGLPGALERGTFPFAGSPATTQFVYDAMKLGNLPMHVFSFAAQFAAIIAIWKRKWVMALTVVYDVFHIVVYLTFGLIFWKWIALNAIILATLAKVPDEAWTRSVRIAMGAAVVLGAVFFKTATLAWYDAPSFMSNFFEAEMEDGTRYRVPHAYFHSASYQVSQSRIYAPSSKEHFNFAIWGSVLPYADLKAARACEPPVRTEPTEERFGPPEVIARYAWANHERVLRWSGDKGHYNYYAYIHHHFPSLFHPYPFDLVDKRDVKAFYFVNESVCLGLENGQLTRELVHRTEIPLPRPGVQ
ncbi:MAG: hypothetical protein AAFR21_07050 [Pseudomonadota bacterium]